MASSSLDVLQASVTKTASFLGASYDSKTGAPRTGLSIRFNITALTGADPTLICYISVSDDNVNFLPLLYGENGINYGAGQDQVIITTSHRYWKAGITLADPGAASSSSNSNALLSVTYDVEVVQSRW